MSLTHGKGSTYHAGCRCEACCAAHRATAKAYNDAHREEIARSCRAYRETHADSISEYKRRWSTEHRDQKTETNQRWREIHRDEILAYGAAYRAANRDKRRATWAVKAAIKSGRMTRQPCESCGNPRADGHHDDYSKPLDVRWLCRSCHRQHHVRCANE